MTRVPGWAAVLGAMVVLTAAATVAYLAAPFDPPPNERADTGRPGMVEPERRITAVLADGSLALLDAGDGSVSEVVVPEPTPGIRALEVGADRTVAYVARADDDAIDAVRLRTGADDRRAAGHALSVGAIAFPQLARTTPRPDVERLAWAVAGEGGDDVVVENLTTGDRRRLRPSAGGRRPFRSIDDLVVSPVGNRLFGIADGGSTVFRLDLDRMSHLSQAVTAPVPEGARVVDATAFGDGLAAVLQHRDGATGIVELDRSDLQPAATLVEAGEVDGIVHVDSDAASSGLLLVTDTGRLFVLDTARSSLRTVADGVALAAW